MRAMIICCLLLCSLSEIRAQVLKFEILFKGQPLELEKEYSFKSQAIRFSKVKFFVSNIAFENKGEFIPIKKKYHLVHLENPNSLSIPLKDVNKEIANCQLSIGVDSTKSVSGVFGEDLDPTNGMYWAWQSGYINCKIEGYSPICPSRKNKFQFHLGGYSYPYNTLRTLHLNVNRQGDQYIIVLNLDQFIENIKLSETYEVMSPNNKAMKLSDIFSTCFMTYE